MLIAATMIWPSVVRPATSAQAGAGSEVPKLWDRMGDAAGPPQEAALPTRELSVEPILKTENLWKVYRSGRVEIPALRGVNFEVMPAGFVAVMGPSGCGKSTLLYVIGGLAQATRGACWWTATTWPR